MKKWTPLSIHLGEFISGFFKEMGRRGEGDSGKSDGFFFRKKEKPNLIFFSILLFKEEEKLQSPKMLTKPATVPCTS